MDTFENYLNTIENIEHRTRMTDILLWIQQTYPDLVPVIKWNQPMFTDHGTYIIGLSISKHHFSVAPEVKTMHLFDEEIKEAQYERTANTIKIKWTQPIDYNLFKKMIDFNLIDKKETTQFWR